MSIRQWHQNVLSAHEEITTAPLMVGRAWDQSATDIFYANDNSPLWFWADERSVKVLDYWLDFDASIHFVFIYTPPHSALITALTESSDSLSLLSLESVLQAWSQRTQAMLNFHLRQPDRSVFIEDSQASGNPTACMEALAKHWHLPLTLSDTFAAGESRAPILELYVAANLLKRHPYAAELDNEVRARLLLAPQRAETSPIIDQVLAELSQRRRDLHSSYATIQELEQRLHTHEVTSIQAEEKNKASLQAAYAEQEKLQRDKLTLELETKELQLSIEDKNLASQCELKEATELNSTLLHQLHSTQEQLEQLIITDQKQSSELEQSRHRLQKLLGRFPDYWDVENITLSLIDDSEPDIIQWNLKNVYLDEYLIPEIQLQTRQLNGLVGLFIQRPAGINRREDWLCWPTGFEHAEELPCMPSSGPIDTGPNLILSNLSTRDWERLKVLVKRLIAYIDGQPKENFPAGVNTTALSKGLANLQTTLTKWPLLFRFDSVQLVGLYDDSNYKALSIQLCNLSLANNRWTAIEYRLATVDQSSSEFGENPRLEFPEYSRDAIQNWFNESGDDRMPRLEIRFSNAGDFDRMVWEKLSDTDCLLIAGIVSSLPRQLSLIQEANPRLFLTWQNWQEMAKMIKTILAKNSTHSALNKRALTNTQP